MTGKLLLISSAVNVLTLSAFLVLFWTDSFPTAPQTRKAEDFYDELCPTVIYNQNESVHAGFGDNGVARRGRKQFDNCINPKTSDRKLRLHYLKKCLPLFKEYRPRAKKVNRALMKSVPSYVPRFSESNTVVDYPYDKTHWKRLYKTPFRRRNLLNQLRFYSRRRGRPS